MPDSFSELRTAGGPNKPWVVGGVLALIVAIIGVALAAAYWYANPRPEPESTVPETVTVTAQQQSPIDDPSAPTASSNNARTCGSAAIGSRSVELSPSGTRSPTKAANFNGSQDNMYSTSSPLRPTA